MPTRKAAAVTRAATTARLPTRSPGDTAQVRTQSPTQPSASREKGAQADTSPLAFAAIETPTCPGRRTPTRPIASGGQEASSARTAAYAASARDKARLQRVRTPTAGLGADPSTMRGMTMRRDMIQALPLHELHTRHARFARTLNRSESMIAWRQATINSYCRFVEHMWRLRADYPPRVHLGARARLYPRAAGAKRLSGPPSARPLAGADVV
jgi:hypothetical protein